MVAHGLGLAAASPRVNAVFCEPVCNHVYSQKLTDKTGFILRALEVDLMPAVAYEKEASASGRVAAFLTFRTYRPRPHSVYPPAAYQDILPFLYENLDEERDYHMSTAGFPSGSLSSITPHVFDFARVARIAVHDAGEDFSSRLDHLEKDLHEKCIQVIQMWLNLTRPWIGQAVEALRDRGHFLGGVLPRWFDGDGLLMQKILRKPDWDQISIYGDRAAKILRQIQADWKRSGTP